MPPIYPPLSNCSYAVELAAAAVIIVGSRYGLPLSTTHCMVRPWPASRPAAAGSPAGCRQRSNAACRQLRSPAHRPASNAPLDADARCCCPCHPTSPAWTGGRRDRHRCCGGGLRQEARGRRQQPRLQLGPPSEVLLRLGRHACGGCPDRRRLHRPGAGGLPGAAPAGRRAGAGVPVQHLLPLELPCLRCSALDQLLTQ